MARHVALRIARHVACCCSARHASVAVPVGGNCRGCTRRDRREEQGGRVRDGEVGGHREMGGEVSRFPFAGSIRLHSVPLGSIRFHFPVSFRLHSRPLWFHPASILDPFRFHMVQRSSNKPCCNFPTIVQQLFESVPKVLKKSPTQNRPSLNRACPATNS